MSWRLKKWFLKKVALFAGAHFFSVWVIGYILFCAHGFRQPSESKAIEKLLGACVIVLGFPDTEIGWALNSLVYGVGFVAAMIFFRCVRRSIHV